MGRFDLARGLAVAALCVGALPSPSDGQQQSRRAAPKVSIYGGGLDAHRTSDVTSRVRVTEDAYVLVVARNLNGEITVLYPESPKKSSMIAARTTLELPSFFSGFDAQPSVGQTRYVVSQGTVFALASLAPLNLKMISTGGEWNIDSIKSLIQGVIPQLAPNALASHLGPKGEHIGVASMWFGADHIPPPTVSGFSDGINP
jgi:hypothetical protein